ncbi:MAG TPA: hypothetical protein VEY07_07740, partial [Thermoplasmata archaeon]|nr:hypothetical protein [Thermoplasmata archaeon]
MRGTPLAPGVSCSNCAFYMQEGASIDQACFPGVVGGCSGGTGFTSLYVDVQVPASSYQIAFELNGYTNMGDWFQSVVGENWCEPGLLPQAEIFNNAGTSVYGPCSGSTMRLQTNDMVQLGLAISTSGATTGDVCFSVYDLTNPQTPYIDCEPQPDGGSNPSSNYFQLSSHAGFFTGPMTEIADPVATACLTYSALPTITYLFVAGAYIVHFTPLSDEWNPSTATTCYTTTASGSWTMSPGDVTAQYVEASAASPYGPHWEAAQNTSLVSSGNWWSFTTDAKLPTPVSTPGSIDAGQASAVGFYEPVGIGHLDSNPTLAAWTTTSLLLTGCLPSSTVENLNCSLNPGSGSDTVQFSVGESGGYTLRSPILTFTVFPDPVLGSLILSKSSVDIGQSLTVTASVAGGSGGTTFAWQGLPTSCVASPGPTFSCRPSTAGWFSVSATATDTNGASSMSPVAAIRVFQDPTIRVVNVTPATGRLDLGQPLG